jgi:hypothetical protein
MFPNECPDIDDSLLRRGEYEATAVWTKNSIRLVELGLVFFWSSAFLALLSRLEPRMSSITHPLTADNCRTSAKGRRDDGKFRNIQRSAGRRIVPSPSTARATAQDCLKRWNGADWRTTRQLSGERRLFLHLDVGETTWVRQSTHVRIVAASFERLVPMACHPIG